MQGNNLNIEIISPEGIVFRDNADEIILPTVQGQIAILPRHAPLFVKLSEGETIIKKDNKEISIAITGGFLEVLNNKISILADYAIKADEIKINRVEEAKMKAEELLKQRKEGVDLTEARTELRRSILELKIADKIRKRTRR